MKNGKDYIWGLIYQIKYRETHCDYKNNSFILLSTRQLLHLLVHLPSNVCIGPWYVLFVSHIVTIFWFIGVRDHIQMEILLQPSHVHQDLYSCSFMQSTNHGAAVRCINRCWHRSGALVNDVIVCARQVVLNMSETADVDVRLVSSWPRGCGDSHNHSLQQWVGRAASQECATCPTSGQMGHNSSRGCRVPLGCRPRAYVWGSRVALARRHGPDTLRRLAWSAESWFLLRHTDGGVWMWCRQHESINLSCLAF